MLLNGSYLRKDRRLEVPDVKKAPVRDLVEVLRYSSYFEFSEFFSGEFYKALDDLECDELLDLVDKDNGSGVFVLYVVSRYIFSFGDDEILSLYQNAEGWWKNLVLAVLILLERLDLIPDADVNALREYFLLAQIDESQVHRFSARDIINDELLENILKQEVLFVWVTKNLTLMASEGLFSVSDNKKFFGGIFKDADYVQYELIGLFMEAVKIDDDVFDEISSKHLRVDPFTKEIDYSVWLKESAKFIALLYLFKNCVSDKRRFSRFKEHAGMFLQYNLLESSFGSFRIDRDSI